MVFVTVKDYYKKTAGGQTLIGCISLYIKNGCISGILCVLK